MNIELPPVLYRFRPWSRHNPDGTESKSVEEIAGRHAWFSCPLRFNDPQDSMLGPEFTAGKGDLDRWLFHGIAPFGRLAGEHNCSITQLDSTKPGVEAAVGDMKRLEARKESCVCCFSRDWSSPLLWTFYAQEHRGFCLGYSTEGQLFQRARPVLYTHSPRDVCHLEDPATNNDPLSFCKSTDWQFEDEWRVCLQERGPKRVDLANEKLISIHVGYRMADNHLQELASTLRKAGHSPSETRLFQMERIPMSFTLACRPINW